ELATLQTQFEQNVLKEKNASSVVVDRKEDLAGLSDNQMASVIAAAKAEHKDGRFVIQMQDRTWQPLPGSRPNCQMRVGAVHPSPPENFTVSPSRSVMTFPFISRTCAYSKFMIVTANRWLCSLATIMRAHRNAAAHG